YARRSRRTSQSPSAMTATMPRAGSWLTRSTAMKRGYHRGGNGYTGQSPAPSRSTRRVLLRRSPRVRAPDRAWREQPIPLRAILRDPMAEESPSPAPIELTHRAFGFLNRRDLDAVMGLVSPTCICDMSRWELDVYTGAEAIRAFINDWLGTL